MVYHGSSGRQGRQGWQPQRQGWQGQAWTVEQWLAWKRGKVDAFALPAGGTSDLTDDRPGRPTPGGTPDLTDVRPGRPTPGGGTGGLHRTIPKSMAAVVLNDDPPGGHTHGEPGGHPHAEPSVAQAGGGAASAVPGQCSRNPPVDDILDWTKGLPMFQDVL